MKAFDKELVSGSILRSVWKLAWPSVLLNLVNGSQGMIAQIIVGHYLGYTANAAISASWQMYLVLFVFLASLFQGMNVIISRHAGMRNREALSNVAYQTFLTSVFLLLFVAAPLGYFASPYLLDLVHAAPEVQAHGLPYLRLLFTCSTPLFLMILVTSAFQASGDPKTPLFLGFLTASLNVSLSAMLITGFGPAPQMGAAGAALGASLAPVPAIVIAITQIARGKTILQLPSRASLVPDFNIMHAVAKVGLPTGVQTVLLNIGGVILLRKVGSLPNSAAAQAAYGICYTQLFMVITWTAFGLRGAASTLMGQNLGAGNPDRARRCVHTSAAIGFVWAMLIGMIFHFFPDRLLAIFDITQSDALMYGRSLLKFLSFSGVFLATALAITGGLQGAGDTKGPMYIAFLTQIIVLLGIVQGFEIFGPLTPNQIWTAILVAHLSRLIFTWGLFRMGRWARIKLDLGNEPTPAVPE